MLQLAGVLAGSDFLPSLYMMGFRTAHPFVAAACAGQPVAEHAALALQALALRRPKLAAGITAEYVAAVESALVAFRHPLGEIGLEIQTWSASLRSPRDAFGASFGASFG